MAHQPPEGQGLLFFKASQSHTYMRNRAQDLNVVYNPFIKHVIHITPNNASALSWNYMNKCHRISWEGRDIGSTVGDSLLPLSVTVP
jgi:hypothetical protein